CLVLHSHAPAPPDISTLSLHDALPISEFVNTVPNDFDGLADHLLFHLQKNGIKIIEIKAITRLIQYPQRGGVLAAKILFDSIGLDRKSTRLNSSHVKISYAVFCLKKKK